MSHAVDIIENELENLFGVRFPVYTQEVSHIGSFLYHPLLLRVDTEHEYSFLANDSLVENFIRTEGPQLNMHLVTPPNHEAAVFTGLPDAFDVNAIVQRWASRQGFRVLGKNYVVVSLAYQAMFLIDFVLESLDEQCIMLVYYNEKRGGTPLQKATEYMKHVEMVCKTYMSFNPTCFVMCVYGTEIPKVYTSRV